MSYTSCEKAMHRALGPPPNSLVRRHFHKHKNVAWRVAIIRTANCVVGHYRPVSFYDSPGGRIVPEMESLKTYMSGLSAYIVGTTLVVTGFTALGGDVARVLASPWSWSGLRTLLYSLCAGAFYAFILNASGDIDMEYFGGGFVALTATVVLYLSAILALKVLIEVCILGIVPLFHTTVDWAWYGGV